VLCSVLLRYVMFIYLFILFYFKKYFYGEGGIFAPVNWKKKKKNFGRELELIFVHNSENELHQLCVCL